MRKTLKLTTIVLASTIAMSATAVAQTVTTQDVSAQLQASLEANATTVVYFGFDKDNITDEAAVVLAQQARWLNDNTNAKVNLAGHTDAVGSNEYNDDLAMRRARAVENFLIQNGVSPAQMQTVISRGENELAVQTENREQLNRRVSTSVNGLVSITVDTPPPPPPPPASRSYADNIGVCTSGRGASLMNVNDFGTLTAELSSRMDKAASVYASETAISSTSNTFNLAAFTKTECGIAIGFAKSKIMDERSITHCACYSDALSKLEL